MTTFAQQTMAHKLRGPAAKSLLVLAVSAMLAFTAGCNKLTARDRLNKGVQAYKASKFEQAENFFREAIKHDSELAVAKLYLATACVAQYIPGAENEDNKKHADCAIEQYNKVLEADRNNILSVKGLASLYFNMKKFDEAKKWNQRAIEIDPNDPENYYSIGVIDWTESYVPRTEKRNELGLKNPADPIKDKKVCEELKAKNWDRVDDGIQKLQKAISLRQDYDDAMAYLNLLYRERADIQCGDAAAREADLKVADEWVQKTMDTKKMKAEKAAQKAAGGIHLENEAK